MTMRKASKGRNHAGNYSWKGMDQPQTARGCCEDDEDDLVANNVGGGDNSSPTSSFKTILLDKHDNKMDSVMATNKSADLVYFFINPVAEVAYNKSIGDLDRNHIRKIHFFASMASRILCDNHQFINRDKYQSISNLLLDMAYNIRVNNYSGAVELAEEAYNQIKCLRKK